MLLRLFLFFFFDHTVAGRRRTLSLCMRVKLGREVVSEYVCSSERRRRRERVRERVCMQKTILINFDVNENFVCYSQIKVVGILRYDVFLSFFPFSSSIHWILSNSGTRVSLGPFSTVLYVFLLSVSLPLTSIDKYERMREIDV